MSDEYLLRDGEGNPSSSIFGVFERKPLVNLINNLWPGAFEIHEIEENVVKKWFREKREREREE